MDCVYRGGFSLLAFCIYFLPSQRWFLQYIFGQLIHENHHKYIPCSLLLSFYLQIRLISGWNRSLRQFITIYSVIWLEDPLILDNSIAVAQLDELTGFFRNQQQFLIYFLICTYYWVPRQSSRVFFLGRFDFERI